MTNTAFAPASAVRRLAILVASVALTLVAIIAPVTASWADTGTGTTGTSTGTTGTTGTTGIVSPDQCKATSVVAQYSNGKIPLTALCALLGTTDQVLRADAAYNFNRLSKAYTKQFATPLCVTGSYRTMAAQKSLYATTPKLAAVPGTSNYGWGVAADLCDAVQTFGTTQYQWLFNNAPKYRWVQPTWAQASGSRPQPSHWEYAPQSNVVRAALGLPVSAPQSGPQDGAYCLSMAAKASTPGARAALRFVCNQLGDAYVWAAAGPNSFDCSGLTMKAWQAGGVTLPHSSKLQSGYGTPVSSADLQPGDLIFFNTPVSHVGIYLGDGLMIHAPHTGDVVRIAPVYATPTAATRL